MSEENNSLYERATHRPAEISGAQSAQSTQERVVETPPLHTQLTAGKLSGQGNSATRITSMQNAQQIYGNRAVQRCISCRTSQTPQEAKRPVRVQRFLDGLMDMLPKDHGIGRPFMLPGMGGGGGLPSFGGLPDFKGMGIGQPFMPGGGELPAFGMPDLGQFGIGKAFEMDPQYLMD